LLAQAVFKTQAVLALVWAVKGGHVLIYVVVLCSQKLREPIGPLFTFLFGAALAGISDGPPGYSRVPPGDRTGVFIGFSFDFCLHIRLELNSFNGFQA
jgi:hypothetical protein